MYGHAYFLVPSSRNGNAWTEPMHGHTCFFASQQQEPDNSCSPVQVSWQERHPSLFFSYFLKFPYKQPINKLYSEPEITILVETASTLHWY